jgi:hypothetical protein
MSGNCRHKFRMEPSLESAVSSLTACIKLEYNGNVNNDSGSSRKNNFNSEVTSNIANCGEKLNIPSSTCFFCYYLKLIKY